LSAETFLLNIILLKIIAHRQPWQKSTEGGSDIVQLRIKVCSNIFNSRLNLYNRLNNINIKHNKQCRHQKQDDQKKDRVQICCVHLFSRNSFSQRNGICLMFRLNHVSHDNCPKKIFHKNFI